MVRQVLLLRTHQSRVSRKISSWVMVQAMEEIGIARIKSVSNCCPRVGFISTAPNTKRNTATRRAATDYYPKAPNRVLKYGDMVLDHAPPVTTRWNANYYFDSVTPAL